MIIIYGDVHTILHWLGLRVFDHSLKAGVVVGDGLGEFKQMPQKILGAEELDAELAGTEVDAGGQISEHAVAGIGGGIDANLAAGLQAADLLELFGQPGAAFSFGRHVFAAGEKLQLSEETEAVDEEGAPGLKTAEPVHQTDGGTPLHPEDFFEDGAVDDGGGEAAELL
jgi:hypothetical protein